MSGEPQFLGPLSHYRPSDLSMSYTDYLQAREFSDRFTVSISEQTQDLIAHSQNKLDVQVEHLRELRDNQAESTVQIVQSLEDLRRETAEGFARVGSVLEWGFSEMLVQAGRTNDLLSDILDTLQHPSRTWAYEQFELAREEYRKGFFEEALDSLDHAIAGFGSNLGFRTEYRFHYLRGIIKLGSFNNNRPAVVDPVEAETAFLLAGRYAEHDFPDEAANAQLCAARAANVQGAHERAAAHAEKGLSLIETAGLHFERAKALASLGRLDDAKPHLHQAVQLDKRLIVAAAGDPHFTDHPQFLGNVLSTHLHQVRDIAVATKAYAETALLAFEAVAYESELLAQTFELHRLFPQAAQPARTSLQNLAKSVKGGGILDIRADLEAVPERLSLLSGSNQAFRDQVIQAIRDGVAPRLRVVGAILHDVRSRQRNDVQSRQRNDVRSQQRNGEKPSGPAYVGIGVTCLYILTGLSQCSKGNVGTGFFVLLGSPLMGLIAWGLAAGVAWAIFKGNRAFFDHKRSLDDERANDDERTHDDESQRASAELDNLAKRASAELDNLAKRASAEESRVLQMPLYSSSSGLDRILPAWARGQGRSSLPPGTH